MKMGMKILGLMALGFGHCPAMAAAKTLAPAAVSIEIPGEAEYGLTQADNLSWSLKLKTQGHLKKLESPPTKFKANDLYADLRHEIVEISSQLKKVKPLKCTGPTATVKLSGISNRQLKLCPEIARDNFMLKKLKGIFGRSLNAL